MSNTPCAYAVDSVLHRRVEIKVELRPITWFDPIDSNRPAAVSRDWEIIVFGANKVAGGLPMDMKLIYTGF